MKLPKDNIGRRNYVDKVKYLVEKMPKDEHFCLALNGGWGSGKSYVMGMLENEFENHDEYIVIYYHRNLCYTKPVQNREKKI